MMKQRKYSLIEREKTCPFLLRLFYKEEGEHTVEQFEEKGKEPVEDELQIHTWMDASLRELSDLVKEMVPAARSREGEMAFSIIYPTNYGQYKKKDIGKVHSTKKGSDDLKQLRQTTFTIGDYIDMKITTLLRAKDH